MWFDLRRRVSYISLMTTSLNSPSRRQRQERRPVPTRVAILMLTLGVSLGMSLGMALPASAEMCAREKLDQAIDGAGEALRKLNQEQTPRIQNKIRDLKAARGWNDSEAEERAYAAAQDKRLLQFDSEAAQLLQKIDQFGAVDGSAKTIDCARVADAAAAGVELQATVKARAQYLVGRLDGLIAESKAGAQKAAPSAQSAQPAPTAQPVAPARPATAAKGAPETQAPPSSKPWSTDVAVVPPTSQPSPPPSSLPPVPQGAPLPDTPPASSDVAQGYSIEEIGAAAKGVFGKASVNLAGVLEQTFAKSGRPTAYIIGSEAGGAIIAGIRYGKGTLVLRTGERVPIFWHGPSIGAELGASGAEVLFLVYKLADPADIFTTFNGVEGSAYAVGGLGGTFLSNGRIQMAPIRAGLGLRLGANIGYTRFTRKQTWNPF